MGGQQMFGINNYVVVIVVNALSQGKSTNFFDRTPSIRVAAANSIYASMGNQHSKTDIQKQAYSSELVKTVRAAYGITGTNFNTHSAYINGQEISLDAILENYSKVILIRKDLNPIKAQIAASRHLLNFLRTNQTTPRKLGTVLTPLPAIQPKINYELNNKQPGATGVFGPGRAGNVDGYGDFGGLKIN